MWASLSGVKLVTRWAVDINSYACKSLKWNHPETKVRNEAVDDYHSKKRKDEEYLRRDHANKKEIMHGHRIQHQLQEARKG